MGGSGAGAGARGAVNRVLHHLTMVHPLQPGLPFRETGLASGEPLEIPKVAENAAAMEPYPAFHGSFEGFKSRRREVTHRGECFQRPVTRPGGNQ